MKKTSKESKKKMKNKYIFPNFMAEAMSKIDVRTQYEATMMSLSFICVGIIVSVIFMFIYTQLALWYKIFLVVNGLAGIIFMGSMLVTTYQQYLNYMEAVDFQEKLKGGTKDAKEN